ncbi:MAG: cell division protein ZapA [Sterolibacterium sp.]|jgi:cell division protein ZapA|nr:cell division protein ZapA [Sterolibacterium sp.]
MSSHSTIDIHLQGREYRVTCAPDERESLLAAVTHVETKMNEIATRTKGSGERLAVMTALNLAHELLNRKEAEAAAAAALATATASVESPLDATAAAQTHFDSPEIARRMNLMMTRMDALMTQQESLL